MMRESPEGSPAEATPTMAKIPIPNQEPPPNEESSSRHLQTHDNDKNNLASLDNFAFNPCQNPVSLPLSYQSLDPNQYFNDPHQSMISPYDPLLMGPRSIDTIYNQLGGPLGSDPSNPFSGMSHSIPTRPVGSDSYLNLPSQPSFLSTESSSSSKQDLIEDHRLKRRKTENDLRSRNIEAPISPYSPLFPSQVAVDFTNPWEENHNSLAYQKAQQARLIALHQPSLKNAVSAFVMDAYSRLENPTASGFENGWRENFNRLETSMNLFLEACDQSPMSISYPGGSQAWKNHITPSQEILGKCLSFFLNDFLRKSS